jgi:hypothetical protein
LRSSIASKVQIEGDSIVGIVGTNISYGKVHEYGFNGIQTVGTYVRRTRAQMKKAQYSYINKDGQKAIKTRMTGKLGKSTGDITVRSHQRHVNFPERSFLRSTLREMADEARQRILTAVREAGHAQ